eukprot:2825322-Prymnesium_polylepis.1
MRATCPCDPLSFGSGPAVARMRTAKPKPRAPPPHSNEGCLVPTRRTNGDYDEPVLPPKCRKAPPAPAARPRRERKAQPEQHDGPQALCDHDALSTPPIRQEPAIHPKPRVRGSRVRESQVEAATMAAAIAAAIAPDAEAQENAAAEREDEPTPPQSASKKSPPGRTSRIRRESKLEPEEHARSTDDDESQALYDGGDDTMDYTFGGGRSRSCRSCSTKSGGRNPRA